MNRKKRIFGRDAAGGWAVLAVAGHDGCAQRVSNEQPMRQTKDGVGKAAELVAAEKGGCWRKEMIK